MMKSRRDDDSLESIDDKETLLDERLCLEEQGCDPMDSPRPSFEHSPDKSTALFRQKMEARDAPKSEGSVDSDERVGPAQLEELIIPTFCL